MRHTSGIHALARRAAIVTLALAAACDSPSGTLVDDGGDDATLVRVQVTPDGQTVQAGATLQFTAAGEVSDGGTSTPGVSWTATGGTITSGGSFTAGQTAGAWRVIATAQNGVADTASVIVAVPSANPTLVGVVVAPASASVAAGGARQFTATGLLSNGATAAVSVTWTATGGIVSGTGLYTAGALPGSYRVTATGPGGLADTAAVTVTQGGPAGTYTRLVGDDWKAYANKEQLRARDYFWWLDSRDVYGFVDLVPDAVFGQVARITFPVNSGGPGPSPRLQQSFAPMDKVWYRWRMRYSPGWTTVGPDPAGHANSYKIGFWGWEGYYGRGEVGLTNTDEYYVGLSVQNPSTGTYVQYSETRLNPTQGTGLGRVGTDWSDGQWYEFVTYYEKTGATSARQHWWKRRLTTGGAVAPGPWTYLGVGLSGGPVPRVDRVELGINKNKSTPSVEYIDWGPWEVVDGTQHPNPFGMPNVP
jgi:hypothetical protein